MSNFKPTDEQAYAIECAGNGDTFVVDACAGSGKTTTARQMCEEIDGRILYLVYNTAASQDAKKTFPQGVRVSTTSALAWGRFPEYHERMKPGSKRVRAKDTAQLAGITKPLELGQSLLITPTTIASLALETIQKYCYSDHDTITEWHTPPAPAGLDILQEEFLRTEVASWAAKIWTQALKKDSAHRFTFDYAFKLLTMSSATGGAPDLGYDTVIIDEAQDSNRATLKLIMSQDTSQKIAIGDPAQQLYAWRGATDIMGEFDGNRLPLSKSFRFGCEVAAEADKWLMHTGTNIRVTGNEAMDSKVVTRPLEKPDAILCRSNATVMAQAIEQMDMGKEVAIVGGTDALRSLAFAANDLMSGKRTTHAELIAFADWGEVMAFTKEPGGGDLKALVQLINEHKVSGILAACDRLVPENAQAARRTGKQFREPDVVISTAHKSKGREWMNVMIADDFTEPEDVEDPITGETEPGPIGRHEAMLHYVTVTRARQTLDRSGLAWIDRHPPVDKLTKAS